MKIYFLSPAAIFPFVIALALAACSDEVSQDRAASGEGKASHTEVAKVTTIHLKVAGMSCQGCVNTVEKALAECEGVVSSSVSLAENAAEVTYDPVRTKVDEIISAINKTGYEASTMN